MSKSLVAVDIGATNIRVASGGPDGIHMKLKEKTSTESPSGVSQQIIDLIHRLDVKPEGIGIGAIGPINIEMGEIRGTPNLPFDRIPIVRPLKDVFNVPVSMLNDCTVGVLGEWKHGAGKDYNNLAYITLSTGLGGGVIVDGHILKGKDGNAAEIGHFTVDPDSTLRCGCGCMGHWEAYCGGSNIDQLAEYVLDKKIGEYRERLGEVTAEKVFSMAGRGDLDSVQIVEEYGRVNAVGFANVVNAYDPEVLTVGGSIALNNPGLVLTPILKRIDNHLINRKPEILITPLGEDIILYGAIALAA